MSQEPFFVEQQWDIAYRHAAGETAGHFLRELQQSQRLWGRRCPQCRRVLMPPRSFCDRCHAATTEWVEVGRQGVIEAFTIVNVAFKSLPDPPYALAYARLDKADTAMCNYVWGVDLSDPRQAASHLQVGTRVKVVFAQERQGRMTDFWYELA